jgi:hypothetical protein
MEFRDAVRELHAIGAPDNERHVGGGRKAALLARLEHLKLALRQRAGPNRYQHDLINGAVAYVREYIERGKPPNHPVRQNMLMALYRLGNAAAFDNPAQRMVGRR